MKLLNKPLCPRIPWLKWEHVVVVKFGLSVALVAAYVVPAPWNIAVGASANLIWMWKV